jgi:hypothetical protein
MFTTVSVARWMADCLIAAPFLYQDTAVREIHGQFGGEFVYRNRRGNLVISRRVLQEFRKMTEGRVVWERGRRRWRRVGRRAEAA